VPHGCGSRCLHRVKSRSCVLPWCFRWRTYSLCNLIGGVSDVNPPPTNQPTNQPHKIRATPTSHSTNLDPVGGWYSRHIVIKKIFYIDNTYSLLAATAFDLLSGWLSTLVGWVGGGWLGWLVGWLVGWRNSRTQQNPRAIADPGVWCALSGGTA
jgi:hypothetical protein